MNDGTVKIGIEFEVDNKELKQVGKDVENSVNKPKKTIEQFAKETGQTVEQVKAKIASLAAEYQAAGMTVQNAFKRAYSDLGVMSDSAAKKQQKALEAVAQAADSAAAGVSDVARETNDAAREIKDADKNAERFEDTAKELENAAENAASGLEELAEEVRDTDRKLDGAEESLEVLSDTAEEAEREIDDAAESVEKLGDESNRTSKKISDVGDGIEKATRKTGGLGSAAHASEIKVEKFAAALDRLARTAGTSVVKSVGLATASLETMGKIAGTSLVAAGTGAAAGMAAIGGGLGSLIAYGSTYNAEIEQLQTSFEVMTGSAEKAAEMIERLRQMGAETPFETKDLAEVTQLLMNYGISAEESLDVMSMLGDVAQGNAEKMKGIAMAYGQMSSAGKVYLEDVKQMIERGFNPLQEISETTGESMDSLYERISDGALAVDEITASMVRSTSAGGKYFESMIKQSQTMAGQVSTLKDNFAMLAGTIAQDTSGAITNSFLPSLNDAVSAMDEAFRNGGFTGLSQQFGLYLGETTATGLEQLPAFMDMGTELMYAVYSGFIQDHDLIRKGLIDVIEKLPEFAEDNINLMYTVGSIFASAIFTGMEQNAEEFAESSVSIIQRMVGFFRTNAPLFKDAATSLIHSFSDELREDGGAIYSAIGDVLSLIPEFIDENLDIALSGGVGFASIIADIITSSIRSIDEISGEHEEEIRDAISEVVDIILEAFEDGGESFGSIAERVITILAETLTEKSDRLADVALNIVYALVGFITKNVPMIAGAAMSLVKSLADGLEERSALSTLIQTAFIILKYLADGFSDNFGLVLGMIVQLIHEIGMELTSDDNLQMLIQSAFSIVSAIVSGIGENLDDILDTAMDILTSLADGLKSPENMAILSEGAMSIMNALTGDLLSDENIQTLTRTAAELLGFLTFGIINEMANPENVSKFQTFAETFMGNLALNLLSLDWGQIGVGIIEGIISGMTGENFQLPDWVSNLATGAGTYGTTVAWDMSGITNANQSIDSMHSASTSYSGGYGAHRGQVNNNGGNTYVTMYNDIKNSSDAERMAEMIANYQETIGYGR